jgi:hypothetical protein
VTKATAAVEETATEETTGVAENVRVTGRKRKAIKGFLGKVFGGKQEVEELSPFEIASFLAAPEQVATARPALRPFPERSHPVTVVRHLFHLSPRDANDSHTMATPRATRFCPCLS